MKKLFLSIGLVLGMVAAQAQTPAFELDLNTTVVKPECLPKVLNTVFSGTEFHVLSAPKHGIVYSWNCWNADRTAYKRFAVIVTRQFQMNPLCSTLGIDAFRKVESSAATSVFNMLKACGRIPEGSSAEWDSYVRLLTIGKQQPASQDPTAKIWFGDKYAEELPPRE